MIDPNAVEEADIELCSAGFDNLLMDAYQEELRSYYTMLIEMKAMKCASVIKDLLEWIDEHPEENPLDVVETDETKYNNLWDRYNAASVEENPRNLSRRWK